MVGALGCHNAALRASCGQQVARCARLCNTRWGIPWASQACRRHVSQHSQQLPADAWKGCRLGSARPSAQRGLCCQIRVCSGTATDIQQPASSDTFVVTTPLYYVNAGVSDHAASLHMSGTRSEPYKGSSMVLESLVSHRTLCTVIIQYQRREAGPASDRPADSFRDNATQLCHIMTCEGPVWLRVWTRWSCLLWDDIYHSPACGVHCR